MIRRGEVIVVGAGPAGLAAAIAARKCGFDATVLDARTPPIDKPCGESILPSGIAALEALGVSLPAECAFPLRGIRFVDGESSARADFAGATGFSVRRVKLHKLLIDRAAEAGVQFRWESHVTKVDDRAVKTPHETFSYRWLIGADGQNSQVRKWAGLEPKVAHTKRFGFCTHFRLKPWSDLAEVHWGRRCQVFITPMSGEEIGVAAISRDPALRLEKILVHFPALAERLRGASRTTREWGDATGLRILPAAARGRVALIGDASGTVDAVTGHGLSASFQQAIALAEAMARGDLRHYQRAHKKISAVPILMSRLMLSMSGNDWIRSRTLRLFQQTPGLFSRMLAIHSEASPLSSVGIAELAGFGWRFLRA